MKYKIGQPVVCRRYASHDNLDIVYVMGCILEIYVEKPHTIYYVEWANDEDEYYTEQMLDIYAMQARSI